MVCSTLMSIDAFYGMGDFMAGGSDSDSQSSNSSFMIKIGMQRSDVGRKGRGRQPHRLQLTQYVARLRSMNQRARSQSMYDHNPVNIFDSDSDGGESKKQKSIGKKSLG